ncbi:hypothetical protein BFJ65_g11907 [Fusarium oxysporum f. sp. cepae]|uniref:Uncharacterized protein n=1 Tax=Fusarium oxysporum f. sp. cepae TaxID=396571 RepID=A0A3L6NC94_FUSOX|nr:hypothetical protein BFJ65_g11907 [Fusarium oxysporum f. sp. cepae]
MLERDRQKAQLRQWMGERQAEEEAEGLFRIVRDKVQRFMTRIPEGAGVDPTPMNWIINTRTYGKQIRYTTPQPKGSIGVETRSFTVRSGSRWGDIRYVAQFNNRGATDIGAVGNRKDRAETDTGAVGSRRYQGRRRRGGR